MWSSVELGISSFLSLTPFSTPLPSPTGSGLNTPGSMQNLTIIEKEPICSTSTTLKPPIRKRLKSQSCHNFTTITNNPHNDDNERRSINPKQILFDKKQTLKLLETTKDRPVLLLTMPSMCDDQDLDIFTALTIRRGES